MLFCPGTVWFSTLTLNCFWFHCHLVSRQLSLGFVLIPMSSVKTLFFFLVIFLSGELTIEEVFSSIKAFLPETEVGLKGC